MKMPKLFSDLWEAISGTEQDFTEGPLNRAIFLLSIPMVLEMLMEAVFAVVDIFFVSKLGAGAVATVGITESMLTLVYAIGMGFSMATTAMVARRIGQKNKEGARRAAGQAILLALTVSVILAIPGIFYAKQLLRLMGVSDPLVEEGFMYPAIMISANAVIMLLFVINAIFRSSGDAALSMRVLWLANICNIILDPCLIFGLGPFPEMGIAGAAVATVIGRGLAVLYQFYLLFFGNGRVQLQVRHFRVQWPIMARLLRISYGGIAQNIIATSSWIGLMRIMAEFGSEALAGYTIAIRVIIFSLLPSWGLSNAASTLVGQNLGAKKPDRAEKSVWRTAFINMAVLAVFGGIFVYRPDVFIRLFIDDPVVIDAGSLALRLVSFGYLAYGFGMVMPQAFNGAGDTLTPTLINLFCFWILEIPLAWLLALVLGWAESGVYWAIVLSESMLAILGISLFRAGRWKKREL